MQKNDILQIANNVEKNLNYLDFTREELDKILKDLHIELQPNEMDDLLAELEKKGFSCEEDFYGYNYDKIDSQIDDTIYDESGTVPMNDEKIDDFKIKTGVLTKENIIKNEATEVFKLLNANKVRSDYNTVYACIKHALDNNSSLYDLVLSSSILDIRKVQKILYDKVLAYQSYLVSLAEVKSVDARLADLAASLQAKPTAKEQQKEFNESYPEANVIENQVKEQDASNTLATTAINMAMEELGPTAALDDIKNRSLEILKEQKEISSIKKSL